MAEIRDHALLLRRIPFSETSLICHFLTETHGRITLMARGARRERSPFRAALFPLYDLQIGWKPGRTGMGMLIDVQREKCLVNDANTLDALEFLAIASSLFHEGDPHGYREVKEGLCLLAERVSDEALYTSVWFLLHETGWLGDLSHCWSCGEAVSGMMFWQNAQLYCQQCGRGVEVSPGLRRGIAGILTQPHIRLSEHDLQSWRAMIASVLREHQMKISESFYG